MRQHWCAEFIWQIRALQSFSHWLACRESRHTQFMTKETNSSSLTQEPSLREEKQQKLLMCLFLPSTCWILPECILQFEIKLFTKSWMRNKISISIWSRLPNMCDYPWKKLSVKNAENMLLKAFFNVQKWAEIQAEPRPDPFCTPSLRLSTMIVSSTAKSSKFKDGGNWWREIGGIQGEWQKSHLHHRAARSPPNSTDALNMRLPFSILLKRKRGRRGGQEEELMPIRGWSGKREGWMDINDCVAETAKQTAESASNGLLKFQPRPPSR